MHHSELEQQFFDYLRRKEFPSDSIIAQPMTGGDSRPDFAVVDKGKDEVLAMFEIKNRIHGQSLDDAFSQLRHDTAAFRGLGVAVYLVVPAASPTFSEPFQFYRERHDGSTEEVPAILFPTFASLLAGKSALKKEEIKREQIDTTDEFRRLCCYMAILCLALIAVDIYASLSGWKIEILTTQRITLLGAAIALFVIPYAQKIKALGFEYERAAAKRNEKEG